MRGDHKKNIGRGIRSPHARVARAMTEIDHVPEPSPTALDLLSTVIKILAASASVLAALALGREHGFAFGLPVLLALPLLVLGRS